MVISYTSLQLSVLSGHLQAPLGRLKDLLKFRDVLQTVVEAFIGTPFKVSFYYVLYIHNA